mmetsp:Transcript_64383/g.112400  ORF Transcript_64383/g.112400 Transcript_64383/m.112400 type:complete len:245 (-) Transcript_64383:386-1120(-)
MPSMLLSENLKSSSPTCSLSLRLPPRRPASASGKSMAAISRKACSQVFSLAPCGKPMDCKLSFPAKMLIGFDGSSCSGMPPLDVTPKRSSLRIARIRFMEGLSLSEVNIRDAPLMCAKKRNARQSPLRFSGSVSANSISHFVPKITSGTGKGFTMALSWCSSHASLLDFCKASMRRAPPCDSCARAWKLRSTCWRRSCNHFSRDGTTRCGSDMSTVTASTRLPTVVFDAAILVRSSKFSSPPKS